MRIHYGEVPDDPAFHPEESGWRGIREPGPVTVQLYAIPAAFLLLLVWLLFAATVVPLSGWKGFLEQMQQPLPPLLMAASTALILPIAVVHEILHAIAYPGWGMTPQTKIGVWPAKGLFYACHVGPMSRNRFLASFAVPYLVLGCLPFAPLLLVGPGAWSTPWGIAILLVSFYGSVLACGDLVGFLLVAAQIPRRAIIRNKGWKTFWRIPE